MKTAKRILLATAVLSGVCANVRASDQEGWRFELAPYIWGAGVNADIVARGQSGDIDASFHDIIENTDAAFMGMAFISYNRFVLYLDYDYLSLEADGKTKNGLVFPTGTKVDADLDTSIATGGIGYRFDLFGEHSTIDVLAGVRNTKLEPTLEAGGIKRDGDLTVTDPVLMLRPSLWLSDNWRLNAMLASSVGGDSDRSYEVTPELQYNFTESFALRLGYKWLYYKADEGKKYTTSYRSFDGDFSGPTLGVSWVFPTKAKAAPAPAPIAAVAPPPPAKCSDTDNDGVCDDRDQCPNTPPGKRVGPAGCDCDYTLTTHFAFDSSKLTEQDKADLDKLAKILVNPQLNFVSGTIAGYTDSVGKPEYNVRLSQRRAEAVADYLAAKGVALGSRMTSQGFGEDNPVADNQTAEGRAENRRVVVSRTDCGPAH